MQRQPKATTPNAIAMIWIGFIAAPVCYIVVGWFIARDMTPVPYPQPLASVFVLAAIGAVALGYYLPPRLLKGTFDPRTAQPAASAEYQRQYQTAMIIRWACFEVPAVMGLVLLVLSGQLPAVIVGGAVALALIYGSRPQRGSTAAGSHR